MEYYKKAAEGSISANLNLIITVKGLISKIDNKNFQKDLKFKLQNLRLEFYDLSKEFRKL